MEDLLKTIGTFLEQKTFLEILDEIYVHPKYEYIKVYYGTWKGFFCYKEGLIISGSYNGNRKCSSLIEGLSELGYEGWKIAHCITFLENDPESRFEHAYILERKKTLYFYKFFLRFNEFLDINLDEAKSWHKFPIVDEEIDEKLEREAQYYYKVDENHDTSIKRLNLTSRAYVCLKMADINDMYDLYGMSQQDLLKIENIRLPEADEIVKAIEKYNPYEGYSG